MSTRPVGNCNYLKVQGQNVSKWPQIKNLEDAAKWDRDRNTHTHMYTNRLIDLT